MGTARRARRRRDLPGATSPETAQASADAVGVALQIVPGLREVHFGVAEGHTLSELASVDATMVNAFRADPVQSPFPGAEAPEAAAAGELRRFACSLLSTPPAPSSSSPTTRLLRLALCELLGIPIARYRQVFPRLDNAAVTELHVPRDPAALASLICLNAPLPTAADNSAPSNRTPPEQVHHDPARHVRMTKESP